MGLPDSWKPLCGDCKGVLHGYCDPNNTPTMAQKQECKRLPREGRKRGKTAQGK